MSRVPPATDKGTLGAVSALAAENNVTSSAPAVSAPSRQGPKLPSCAVCRSRKVRCDKLSPCSNCRRANINCVFPSKDRPPRWARRLKPNHNDAAATTAEPSPAAVPKVDQVMDRLRNLENLVKEIGGHLELANTAASSPANPTHQVHSSMTKLHEPGTDRQIGLSSAISSDFTTKTAGVQKQLGKLVLQDATESLYIGSGFWSRVNDELDNLKTDAAFDDYSSSEDEHFPISTSILAETKREYSAQYASLFRNNLSDSTHNLRELHPLPSQIPFLLTMFSERVNIFSQLVHMPTVSRRMHDLRKPAGSRLAISEEALMFSVYYAAVTSMEDEDVITNFGSTKAELSLKYRLGLEQALTKADFLSSPNPMLVQAFTIFLLLVSNHEKPMFVWMMTGLAIRMAHAVGLHQDGSSFERLTPFEVETRRKIWWGLCALDVRASENQGTDLSITIGSYDTKYPLNINDADIHPETKETPANHQGLTDMTIAIAWYSICNTARHILAPGVKEGSQNLQDQNRILEEMNEKLERNYLQYPTEPEDTAHQTATIVFRLMKSKFTLLIYLPTLFSSPSEEFPTAVRNKLLVAALESAEFNHAIHIEQASRRWRWIFRSYTHWHAVVYLLMEITRREWSPMVERAWIALHSTWLIPSRYKTDKNAQFWIPIRNLMGRARKHRDTERERLRRNTQAIEALEISDRNIPVPDSSCLFSAEKSGISFQQHWRNLFNPQEEVGYRRHPSETQKLETSPSSHVVQGTSFQPQQQVWSNTDFRAGGLDHSSRSVSYDLSTATVDLNAPQVINPGEEIVVNQMEDSLYANNPTGSVDWTANQSITPEFIPWLWDSQNPTVDGVADVDVNMDVDGGVDWYGWLKFAQVMEGNIQ